MTVYGANPQELQSLGSALDDEASALGDVWRTLTFHIDRAPWTGGDADRFRGAWRGPKRPRFNAATVVLRTAAESLRQNALGQERASGLDATSHEVGGYDGPQADAGMLPPEGASVEDVEAWWAGLSDDDRSRWTRENPSTIGNRDGIPLEDRFEANRLAMEREKTRLVAVGEQGEADLRAIDKLLREGTRVLHFDSPTTTAGGYRIAVALGDLENATSVAITVSGTGSDLDQFANNFYPETVGLIDYDSGRAAIATLVWDTPEGGVTTPWSNAAIENNADSFVGGPIESIVATADREFGNVALVGHSAGAVSVQELITRSPETAQKIDGVVLLAPPAINPEIMNIVGDDRRVYVALNTNDPLERVDGVPAVWNGLGWEEGYDFGNVRSGEVAEFNGANVRTGHEQSGLGTNPLHVQNLNQTGHHGNSTYFDNYGDDALRFVLREGELANQDELTF